MFAPRPYTLDGWFVIPGRLRNGEKVDVFSGGGSVRWQKPTNVNSTFKNFRWRKYLRKLTLKEYKKHRKFYARYLCTSWNRSHGPLEKLEKFTIYFMSEKNLLDNQTTRPKKVLIYRHHCFKKSKKKKKASSVRIDQKYPKSSTKPEIKGAAQ